MRRAYGSIRKQGGSWLIRWTSPSGRRCSKTVRGTREDAERELALRYGTEKAKGTVTWQEYWDMYVVPSLEPLEEHTKRNYRNWWRSYAGPVFGSCRIGETSHRMVQDGVDGLASWSTRQAALRCMKKASTMALHDGIIDTNPCSYISCGKKPKSDKDLWGVPDVLDAMEKVRGNFLEPFVLIGVGGGLRAQELYGLRWSDIADYRGYAAVRVKRAVVTVDGGTITKCPKTPRSERIVFIGSPFASRILELKALHRDGCISDRNGAAITPHAIAQRWRRFISSSGVKPMQIRLMRSVYATLHGEALSPDGLVSLSMGHSDGTTRGESYQQATVDGLIRIADNLARHIDGYGAEGGGTFDEAALFGD